MSYYYTRCIDIIYIIVAHSQHVMAVIQLFSNHRHAIQTIFANVVLIPNMLNLHVTVV